MPRTSAANKRRTSKAAVRPSKLSKATRSFLAVAGEFIEHWGFKRIQGEIWGLVFLSQSPLTATEVASQLGVSKALVSLAMKELLEYRVLLIAESSDAKSQLLVPNENLGEAICLVLRLREQMLIDRARVSLEAVRSGSITETGLQSSPDRFAKLETLLGTTQEALSSLITLVDENCTART